ncbi:MAG TPA: sugar ABC transporter permease [Acidimicrobiales bacterium]|nr:sugar ABC transporter permease [Acidimicrobiales bacterium]
MSDEAAVGLREGAVRRPRTGVRRWLRRHAFEVALCTPLVLYIVVLTLAPIVDTFRLSLSGPRGGAFPSIENYSEVFDQEVFRTAIKNTVIVALLSLTLELGIGLAVALTLNAKFRGQGLVRTLVLVPLGVPTIVSGAVMLLIFSRSGYLNSLMFWVSDVVNLLPGVDWEFQPLAWTVAGGWRTLLTIAIADMWKVLPVVTLIFLAGLQSVSPDVYEAAAVDGATKWQRFTRITLPMLVPFITMALILRAIDAFRIFELALVLAGRIEPVLSTYIADRYLPPTNDPFTAAAGAVVLFAIIMVFIVVYLCFVARRVETAR